MNLLISAGTTIAYLSSIATLIVDAMRMPASDDAMEQYSTNYLDAVVFLTMFILQGRYLEAYSKAKTGNAVTMLGKLRPTEATLLTPRPSKEISSIDEELPQVTGYTATTVSVDLLEAGDVVRVNQGA